LSSPFKSKAGEAIMGEGNSPWERKGKALTPNYLEIILDRNTFGKGFQ